MRFLSNKSFSTLLIRRRGQWKLLNNRDTFACQILQTRFHHLEKRKSRDLKKKSMSHHPDTSDGTIVSAAGQSHQECRSNSFPSLAVPFHIFVLLREIYIYIVHV